ncbi:hypothetical protein VXQ18_08605 [Brucella abortus]|nr:hypothetical protein [Brucella abortus]
MRVPTRWHENPRRKDRWRLSPQRLEDVDFNSPIADVFVVWAKSAAHDNAIRGFILEKGHEGTFSTERSRASFRCALLSPARS